MHADTFPMWLVQQDWRECEIGPLSKLAQKTVYPEGARLGELLCALQLQVSLSESNFTQKSLLYAFHKALAEWT